MNPIIKNILAVIVGYIVGSILNYAIVYAGAMLSPMPEGVIMGDMESLKNGAHLFKAQHFIFPFLAHALGTLAGAFTAAKIAANNKMIFAFVIGGLFFLGGAYVAYDMNFPIWMDVVDLILAYVPFAWLGGKLGSRSKSA